MYYAMGISWVQSFDVDHKILSAICITNLEWCSEFADTKKGIDGGVHVQAACILVTEAD